MNAPSTAALAALLASHPEECAAVLCALCVVGPKDPTHIALALWAEGDLGAQRELARSILNAIGPLDERTRMAIARVGAAEWLRSRVGPPASTNPLNLGAIRLCALASEGARLGAIFVVASATALPLPRNAEEYRARLLDVERASEGLPVAPLDVEAEVAAVWGAAPATKEPSK